MGSGRTTEEYPIVTVVFRRLMGRQCMWHQMARVVIGWNGLLTLSILGLFGWGCADSHLVTVIEVTDPAQGAVLGPSADQDPDTDGFQFAVRVDTSGLNSGQSVVLEHGTDGSPLSTEVTAEVQNDGSATFPLYTFPMGSNVIRIHAEDDEGAVSEVTTFTVGASEVDVAIQTPADGAGLSADSDCSTSDAGYQVSIVATTSAIDGSLAEVWVGGDPDTDTPVATGLVEAGQVEFCIDADEGVDIGITVRVTSGTGEDVLTAEDSVTVTIDLLVPINAISDLTVSYFTDQVDSAQRRAGEVAFQWTSVGGGGSGNFSNLDHYVLRCSTNPIVSEDDWEAAEDTEVILNLEPSAEGTPETEAVGGFQRMGVTVNCALRGVDAGDALTPLVTPTGSIPVMNTFAEQTITAASDMSQRATAVGDVNGDGLHDFVVNATGAAYLYYGVDGSVTAFAAVPDVTFTSSASVGFSTAVAGIGDFNGDGRDDFALADSNEGTPAFGGAVYVIYGRSDSDGPTPWPSGSAQDVASAGCNADVCFQGSTAILLLGADIGAAGDFDGDGLEDIAITALGANGFAGQVYIILGRLEADLPRGQVIELPVDGGFDVEGFTVEGAAALKVLGTAIAGLGDTNEDGRSDVALGASGTDSTNGVDPTDDITGEVRFISGVDYGTSTGLVSLGNGVLVMEDVPGASAESFGFASWLANIGDFNGEGGSDLAVFSPGWVDDDGTPGLSAGDTILNDGKVLMFLGNGALSNSTPFVTFSNDSADNQDDEFGIRIAQAWHPTISEAGFLLTDFDNDGFSDMLVDSVQTGTGPSSSYLFYGHANAVDRVASSAEVVLPGFTTAQNHTRAVGDINTDGYPDLLIVDNGIAHLLY